MNSVTEEQLPRKTAQPESASVDAGAIDFAAVVARYEAPLLRYVGKLLHRDQEESEDVVQEVFCTMHRYVQKNGADSIHNPSVWLFRIAHNMAIDAARQKGLRRRTRGYLDTDTSEPGFAADEGLDALVQREACKCAVTELDKLPDDLRQVLLLKIIQGLNFRQIGEVTGLTTGNVAYKLNRGLKKLAQRLKETGVI